MGMAGSRTVYRQPDDHYGNPQDDQTYSLKNILGKLAGSVSQSEKAQQKDNDGKHGFLLGLDELGWLFSPIGRERGHEIQVRKNRFDRTPFFRVSGWESKRAQPGTSEPRPLVDRMQPKRLQTIRSYLVVLELPPIHPIKFMDRDTMQVSSLKR